MSDLEYLSIPTGSRDSQKTSQGSGPMLIPTPIPGLGPAWGDPRSSRLLRQSLTIGLDYKRLIICDRQQLRGVEGTLSEDQTAYITGL